VGGFLVVRFFRNRDLGIYMNTKIYAVLFISLFALNSSAMEEMKEIVYENKKLVAQKRNAAGMPSSYIETPLDHEDCLYHEELYSEFADLIKAKHEKNDSFILAKTVTLGTKKDNRKKIAHLTHYGEAHALNYTLFGKYVLRDDRRPLDPLDAYKHPVSGKPLQCLEYYECAPNKKVFRLMCSYAELCNENKEFWWSRLAENQNDDLMSARLATCRLGDQYRKQQDWNQAMQCYRKAAAQTHNLSAAAIAKLNMGVMYRQGRGVTVDYARAKKLYEEVINQKHDLMVAARGKVNLGIIYYKGYGVEVDYARAKKLYQEAANQTHNLEVAADAKNKLAELETLMKKNG